jgi:N6-L-threonylcarbamoyladenine synthase
LDQQTIAGDGFAAGAPPVTGRIVLGIETSCDETAAAVIRRDGDGTGTILSNVIHSQIDDHAEFGGVVPEIAARAHVEIVDGIVRQALDEADVAIADLDAVAVTAGPGLIGGLIAGVMTAKAISFASGKPLIAINHLEGHALTARLSDKVSFPHLLLLVSGGHTQVLAVRGIGDYERLATTIDDAVGEAFDKTAKLLGLPYPGGPAIEKAARHGDARRFALPRPMRGETSGALSFSGLKTAVRQAAEGVSPVSEQDVCDIAASFQTAITETLGERVAVSLVRFRAMYPHLRESALVVAGGVAANAAIRAALDDLAQRHGFRLVAPPAALCTDNAVMIAWAGAERIAAGLVDGSDMDFVPRPRWPLDEKRDSGFGTGKRGAKA